MNEKTSIPGKTALFALVAVLALAIGISAGWVMNTRNSSGELELQSATALQEQARPVPEFSLTDDSGASFDNSRLNGKWSFLFFGYTSCPDICPLTLSKLDKALEILGNEQATNDIQVVFVSVDPWRDDARKLAEYMKYFNSEFIGVTGNAADIEKLTTPLGILFNKLQPDTDENYLVDHSASILLIGPEGNLQAVFSIPHDSNLIASDFEKLRQYHSRT